MFNLFKLHNREEDKNSSSWIWANLDSSFVKKIYKTLLKVTTNNKIALTIKEDTDVGFSTIAQHLIRLKRSKGKLWFPIILIEEILKIWKNSFDISEIEYEKTMNIINNSFESFQCKIKLSQRVKTVKEIDINLAKIIGAHLADGYLQKSKGRISATIYKLKITDERKDDILNFKKWVEECFGLENISVKYNDENNEWRCWVRNKIIGRYFERIFGVPTGKKFDIAKEPEIIKKSSLEIRRAFALGVFTFDGGVKTTGMVALTTKSKQLADDLIEILKLDNLKMNLTYNKPRNIFALESETGRNKETIKKWLKYFECGIWKYKRLDFFLHPNKYPKQKIFELFPENRLCKISLKDVYSAIEKLKTAKPKEIIKELKHEKRVETLGNTTIYKHLFILNKAGLVSKHQKYLSGRGYGIRQVTYKLVR